MSQRKQALGRIWTLVWLYTVGMVVSFAIMVVAMTWGTIDIVWQLLSGRDDLSESATPAKWISRTYQWMASQTVYIFTGGGDGQWRALP